MSEQVRSSFQKWDAKGTGFISKDELILLIRSLDPQITDGELKILFAEARIEGEDRVRYERFVSWLFFDTPPAVDPLSSLNHLQAATDSKPFWEVALSSAMASAAKNCPMCNELELYFRDVRSRIKKPEFADQVQRLFAQRCSGDQAQGATVEDAIQLAEGALQCCSIMAALAMPTPDEIRAAFNAHDAQCGGQGRLPVDGLVNVMRYLQVQVALATLMETEARKAADLELLKSNNALREKGLWEGAMASAKLKAYQRYEEGAVDAYFNEVRERLRSAAYEVHVKGPLFTKVDSDKDGKVSFTEASGMITSALVCSADLAGAKKPTTESVREVFDAHDTISQGWEYMGGVEFLNLMRFLQVQIAEAMLPLSLVVKPECS